MTPRMKPAKRPMTTVLVTAGWVLTAVVAGPGLVDVAAAAAAAVGGSFA